MYALTRNGWSLNASRSNKYCIYHDTDNTMTISDDGFFFIVAMLIYFCKLIFSENCVVCRKMQCVLAIVYLKPKWTLYSLRQAEGRNTDEKYSININWQDIHERKIIDKVYFHNQE